MVFRKASQWCLVTLVLCGGLTIFLLSTAVSAYGHPSVFKNSWRVQDNDFKPTRKGQVLHETNTVTTRRDVVGRVMVAVMVPSLVWGKGNPANAASGASSTPFSMKTSVEGMQDAYETLGKLLDNWERATVDCTYADVPRELLEQKNKEELLVKASTFALFDKSGAVVSCKMNNRLVRDYIGATGKGPLVQLEKKLLNPQLIDSLLDTMEDPSGMDDYFANVETFSRAISKASSLSYMAGTADFDSMNNFAKGENNKGGTSNLDQSKVAIAEARDALGYIIRLIPGKSL